MGFPFRVIMDRPDNPPDQKGQNQHKDKEANTNLPGGW
jgi:hypothetical protein